MVRNIKWYFYLLLLAPLIGYLTYYILNGYIAWQILSYVVLPLFVIFIYHRKASIVIPRFFYLYIAYAIYIYIWKIYNGYYNEKGLLKYVFNNYHVYYIIPRMNPDAAEKMFGSIKTGMKTNTNKYDSDNDGRVDEDGPDDLNKDGYITMMRVNNFFDNR